jgi:hypothetical protein
MGFAGRSGRTPKRLDEGWSVDKRRIDREDAICVYI